MKEPISMVLMGASPSISAIVRGVLWGDTDVLSFLGHCPKEVIIMERELRRLVKSGLLFVRQTLQLEKKIIFIMVDEVKKNECLTNEIKQIISEINNLDL